jgi:hypothetical protein
VNPVPLALQLQLPWVEASQCFLTCKRGEGRLAGPPSPLQKRRRHDAEPENGAWAARAGGTFEFTGVTCWGRVSGALNLWVSKDTSEFLGVFVLSWISESLSFLMCLVSGSLWIPGSLRSFILVPLALRFLVVPWVTSHAELSRPPLTT